MTFSRNNIGCSLSDIETPILVLDAGKMDENIERMRRHLRNLGVAFRPHVKTSKNLHVVRAMLGAHDGPITVSTLKEAEYFAMQGMTDILYAVGITPNKLAHAARLRATGVRLTIVLDSMDVADSVCRKAGEIGTSFDVMIEIDSDGHRSGVAPASTELVNIARILKEGGQTLKGVMTHAGSSYQCETINEIRAKSDLERDMAVSSAECIRDAGFSCPVVSIGSTPTATFAQNLAGVTEVRAGVFAFGDLVMMGLGVCRPEDIALSVATTVIGHQREKGWVITDAGWMAMSRDRGTSRQKVDQGYGLVCDHAGKLLEDVLMIDANQEHGIIAHRSGDPRRMPHIPVGTVLRILPNHACATAAQHSCYHIVHRNASVVVDVWDRINGW